MPHSLEAGTHCFVLTHRFLSWHSCLYVAQGAAVTADKVSMVFEVFHMLIRECRDRIRNLWERRNIEDVLGKLVHRRHDFGSRMRALKLVLEFIDAAYDVERDAVRPYRVSAALCRCGQPDMALCGARHNR